MRGSLDTSSIPSKLLFGADSDSLYPGPTDRDNYIITNDKPGSYTGNYISSIQKSNKRIKHEEKHRNIEKEIQQNFIILSDIHNSIQKYEYIPKTSIRLFSITLGKNLKLLEEYRGKNLKKLKSKYDLFNTEQSNFKKNHTSYWRKNDPKNITRKQMKSQ